MSLAARQELLLAKRFVVSLSKDEQFPLKACCFGQILRQWWEWKLEVDISPVEWLLVGQEVCLDF